MQNKHQISIYSGLVVQHRQRSIKLLLPVVCIGALVYNIEGPCLAEDLTQALQAAYSRSEIIANAAAEHEADLERVTISRAAGLPEVNASLSVNEAVVGPRIGPDLLSVQGGISLPLYRGGSVKNQIKAAKAQSDASYVGKRTAEAQVFSEVVAAYANVIRDRQILVLSRENLDTLTTTLNATRARFQVRDLTRTDVAQAESRVALAQGEVETAEANLIEAMEEFQRVTGMQATDLAPMPVLRNLPPDPETAARSAVDENPDILRARAVSEARRYEWRAARGGALPSVSAVANGRYGNSMQAPAQADNSRFGATVGFSINVPLFQGGRTSASIREANLRENQALLAVSDLERRLTAQARSEYANWQASSSVVMASQRAVTAARSALAGVRAESDVGTRTILDILNAEQELRNAQVQLVSAQRDSYVAAFALLTTMGRTQAHHLGVGNRATELVPEPETDLTSDLAFAPETDEPELAASSSAGPWPKIAVEDLPIAAASSPVPPVRPAAPERQETPVVRKATPEFSPQPVRPSTRFEPTQWVIQLAAFSTQASAQQHWQEIEGQTKRLIGPGRPVITSFRSAGNEMFRLAFGPFPDFAAAEAACHDLRLGKQNCIVRRFSTLGVPQWTGPLSGEEGER
ncbi:TolC family outer membrane protein [Porphyrobacter sp. AAP82]|uniref:TolC family outer membrane protein n=1 Tax=Porphyrobacter sp. AAP82 TaxID=1248917 RepID=UPI0002F29165|nr:TolC family outer membrane protein [Porphyrobacter sp. AAP82]